MTEAEKLLLATLTELSRSQQTRFEETMNMIDSLESVRESENKATLNSLRRLAQRVEALEKLSGQVTQLSEQNRELIEQLRQLTRLSS